MSSGLLNKDPLVLAVDAQYGLTELHSLLASFIRAHPHVDGVDLQPGSLGDPASWVVDKSWSPPGLSCGEWTFQQKAERDTDFVLIHPVDATSAVILHCRLNQKGHIKILSFGREEKQVPGEGEAP